MTYLTNINDRRFRSSRVPRSVGRGAEAVISSRGDPDELKAVFERSLVPMVMVDSSRRYVEVNRPARLWFRRSLDEMRAYAMEHLAPADRSAYIERHWQRLLETGCLAGHYLAAKSDGSRVETVYVAIADVLPGMHVSVFAPVDWPEEELGALEDAAGNPPWPLTPRELELLALAADGLSGPDLAERLGLSPATVNTHFRNIYLKLDVRSRAGAVAKAMRVGLIN
jgi:DNA-binding CsgD family transcriptional regulator